MAKAASGISTAATYSQPCPLLIIGGSRSSRGRRGRGPRKSGGNGRGAGGPRMHIGRGRVPGNVNYVTIATAFQGAHCREGRVPGGVEGPEIGRCLEGAGSWEVGAGTV